MLHYFLSPLFFFFSLWTAPSAAPVTPVSVAKVEEAPADLVYGDLVKTTKDAPSIACFRAAADGFFRLRATGAIKKNILAIADFSLSSNTKRLWIVNMDTHEVLYHTLVAHGRNTGDEFAQSFSNAAESNKSSLGFYATGAVYTGKHGVSLRLNGLERDVNDRAMQRAVVMHGADYVSEDFIRRHTRLGRSLGCPAIPNDMVKPVIDVLRDGSCLYIYHPSHCKVQAVRS